MSIRTEASFNNLSSIISNSRSRIIRPSLKKKTIGLARHSISPSPNVKMLLQSPTTSATYKKCNPMTTSSLEKGYFPVLSSSDSLLFMNGPSEISLANSKLISSNSIKNFSNSSKSLLYKASEFDGKLFTVTIKTNWGNPSYLSLSSINLLNENRVPIKHLSVDSMPQLDDVPGLESLVNSNLVKNSRDNAWSIPWPNQSGSISIILSIGYGETPKYLRVWNATTETDASARDIEVYEGTKRVFKGEAPKGFGVDFPLSTESSSAVGNCDSAAVLQSLFPELIPERGIEDIYGRYPNFPTERFAIEIYSTWSDEKTIGLNGIDIYDNEYKKVPLSNIKDIIIVGCSSFSDPDLLFRVNKNSIDYNHMFMAETKWTETPKIVLIFEKPVRIIKVQIWNFNAEKRSLKYGIKNFGIRIGNRLVYNGKTPMATGRLVSIEYNTTNIWLVDVPKIRAIENYEEEEGNL